MPHDRHDTMAACMILAAPAAVLVVLVLHAVLPWLAWATLVLAETFQVLG